MLSKAALLAAAALFAMIGCSTASNVPKHWFLDVQLGSGDTLTASSQSACFAHLGPTFVVSWDTHAHRCRSGDVQTIAIKYGINSAIVRPEQARLPSNRLVLTEPDMEPTGTKAQRYLTKKLKNFQECEKACAADNRYVAVSAYNPGGWGTNKPEYKPVKCAFWNGFSGSKTKTDFDTSFISAPQTL